MAKPLKNSLITRMTLVADFLRQLDPEGLHRMGAPRDEYEHEAVMIVQRIDAVRRGSRLKSPLQHDTVRAICHGVFVEMFGNVTVTKPGTFANLARDIIDVVYATENA